MAITPGRLRGQGPGRQLVLQRRRAPRRGPAKRGFLESRLGPYATKQEAERGLEELHRRNAEMDEEDRKWEEG